MAAAGAAMWLSTKAVTNLGSAIHSAAGGFVRWGEKNITGWGSSESDKRPSPMKEATKAGTMGGAGTLYGFAYYPASGQLAAPAPGALPAEIIDAVVDTQPPALPGAL